jgi:hypothetical protein
MLLPAGLRRADNLNRCRLPERRGLVEDWNSNDPAFVHRIHSRSTGKEQLSAFIDA